MIRVCLSILLVVAIGCGGSGPPAEKLFPVEGKVTVKGKPLEKGSIQFFADKEKGNETILQPTGAIKDGAFVLKSGERPGAPAGEYKVVVVAMETSDSTKPPKYLVNQKYTDAAKSGLRVKVSDPPAPNAYNFDLEP